jgi:hypothetical protein
MRSRELKLTIPIGVLKAICIWLIFLKNRDYQKIEGECITESHKVYKVLMND